MSYTHSCSLHVAAQLAEEVSGCNRSMSIALAGNRKVNRLHTTVDGIHNHIEDIPAMLNELHVHAKLIEDAGMRAHMLGVRTLLLLKSVLLGLICIVVRASVWDMSHVQKNTTPGQAIAVHRYRCRVQLREVMKESFATPLVPDALHGRVPLVTVRKRIHDHIGRAGAIPRWEQGWRKFPSGIWMVAGGVHDLAACAMSPPSGVIPAAAHASSYSRCMA